jgi:hypothetical protein
MTTTYQGRRQPNGTPWVTVASTTPSGAVRLRRLPLARSLRLSNHSPTGFEWGYGGSGPAQLALAILLDYAKGRHSTWWAVTHHQPFKWHFVANWPREGFKLQTEAIEVWERSLEEKPETSP